MCKASKLEPFGFPTSGRFFAWFLQPPDADDSIHQKLNCSDPSPLSYSAKRNRQTGGGFHAARANGLPKNSLWISKVCLKLRLPKIINGIPAG